MANLRQKLITEPLFTLGSITFNEFSTSYYIVAHYFNYEFKEWRYGVRSADSGILRWYSEHDIIEQFSVSRSTIYHFTKKGFHSVPTYIDLRLEKRAGNVENMVWVNTRPLNPKDSLDVVSHSPTGFSWGYGGSGPMQLSLAILLHEYGLTGNYKKFCRDFISLIPNDVSAIRHTLVIEDIHDYL